MDWIRPHLAIGRFLEALDPPPEVDALLCVAAEKELDPGDRLFHKVPVVDMRPIPAGQLAEAVVWIRGHLDSHRILVFCNQGVGRSPSTVVGYLCLVEGMGFGEAVEEVASRRPGISTLPGLIDSIREAGSRV